MNTPLVTVAVPSFNQGAFLDAALASIFQQDIPLEVFVMDGGSTDGTIDIIKKWEHLLSGWRSHRDDGQASAINEGIALGKAPFVCWLNSDDLFLPDGLKKLLFRLMDLPDAPMVYGQAWNHIYPSGKLTPIWVEPFSVLRLSRRCIIAQPATLIRRSAWESVCGLNKHLQMAMDYDLWWRLYRQVGNPCFLDQFVAINTIHQNTKTTTRRRLHYREAMGIVYKYYGSIPLKWWLYIPYSVCYKTIRNRLLRYFNEIGY
ncbi:glycosyltransferase [Polynucleobacter sp. AP-Jannik-300A-C4]|uniref:glycosyltransferase n=1 Tax=Polynucleobacter sp. AP-Jannik-300A-C4 TaxID=2576928 RepID=UPI001BFD3509|nr:glycosyltransferase [Polynucleobacter sp. AP-Jannik-300A-C4]QWE22956.1 glycosyltransferase [Polynucleobacter sp. AP-Jannik-300A-C4]